MAYGSLASTAMPAELFDVAVVGGGPAGLSAALLLGRSRRRVVVFDHGRPRNYAAKAVHGFLTLDGISPGELRKRGREQCAVYGVEFRDLEVESASRLSTDHGTVFELRIHDGSLVRARKVLLATGVKDDLPAIAHIHDFYGTSVHHCPYCDGWEHRDQRLVGFGQGKAAVELALMLLNWSASVTLCTNGQELSDEDLAQLANHRIGHRTEAVNALIGKNGILEWLTFKSGQPLLCDAIFFSASQGQRSGLALMLGCECDENGQIVSQGKKESGVPGLFVAGDADGDVQFAVVAAAEGAIAATAINQELHEEDIVNA
jgi:thioredoxin reductase